MNPRNVLSEEYSGDAAWRNFVATCRGEGQVPRDYSAFLAEVSDEELGIVLAALMGARGLDWLRRPCRALDDETPEEVIKSGASGMRAVRTLLMRMPAPATPMDQGTVSPHPTHLRSVVVL